MNRTISVKLGILTTVLALSYVASLGLVLAHEGEEHENEAEAMHHEAEVKAEMSVAQMEQMVKLLQQLVTILTQYKAQYGTYTPVRPSTPPPAYVAPVAHEDDEDEHHEDATHEEEEEHEHDMATSTTPVKTLVIEVEPHNGKTHIHIRYVDKPEEMFFVDTAITDEDGIVADIVTKTGLDADVARDAIKFME